MTRVRAAAALLLTFAASRAAAQRADAVLLVNSTSARYADATQYVRPYLDHFGVPYTVLDIATTSVGPEIADYALIVVGHSSLDPTHSYLSTAEQANLSNAVALGCGLVNFDFDLTSDGITPRYQYVQDVFGFGYQPSRVGNGMLFGTEAPGHYISSRHQAGETIATSPMTVAAITVPTDVTVMVRVQSTGTPLVAATSYGQGRAVQWGSYAWMSHSVLGPIHGMDDLVWRSLVWAARKPFVMRGMPNFLTMRVDDVVGGFWWVTTANSFQLKPWLGLFYTNISNADAAQLSALVNAGLATASVHAKGGSDFFYFDYYSGQNFSDSTIASNFADATAWHSAHGIPIAKYVTPHYYDVGTNAFAGLQNWGIEFLGIQQEPGTTYGSPWAMEGPYRLFETGSSSDPVPGTYADYAAIAGHPELANKFFNCVTEIRDDFGYEWSPDNDVDGSIGRGTRQSKRAFDSMALATLFTHEGYIQAIDPGNWQSILDGIVSNLASYSPVYVTLDYACQYLRAKHDSRIISSLFDPATQTITTSLSGSADIPTQFLVFSGVGGTVIQAASSVPAFSGSTQVTQQLGAPPTLLSIAVTPVNPTIPTGATQQFIATGTYSDASTQNITGQVAWVSSNGAVASISAAGVATAVAAGTTLISANQGAVSGSTTATVQDAPLTISTPSLPTGVQGQAYSATMLATGGAPPYAWSLSSGTLPNGLGLSAGGLISGTPTATGTFSFTVSVTDAAARSVSGSFSIAVLSSVGLTIWPAWETPGIADHGADAPVELGVKFRSDVSGSITGIRFYKANTNTGAHVGNLWTSTGTLLATATFAGETASGWQQVNFAAPVPIAANTVYVASYHTNVGHYSQDLNYFAGAGYDNSPLHALSSEAVGGNAVYAYGSTSSFPNGTYNACNYWVDVVFSPGAAPTLSSIAVTPANPTVAAGSTQQFTATGTYSDGTTQNITGQVTWASSSSAVATVNAVGLATTAASGTTNISATLGSVSGSAALTVTQAVASVVVTPALVRLAAGATWQFNATGYDSQGSPIPGLGFTWSTTGGGSITQTGLFTAGSTAGAFTGNVVASTGGVSGSASTEIVALSALSLAPAVVVEGDTSIGTVALSGSAPTDVTVALSSSSAAATVPASVVVPAGATSAAFAVATSAVSATTSATITASAGGATRTATLSVRALTVTLSPTSVIGGNTSAGTLTLSASIPTPVTVALSSSNPAASVPASVTIAAGATNATFTVTTSAVTVNTALTISATSGTVASTAALTVRAATFTALTRSPTAVVEGDPSTGTVTFSGPAPAGGATLTLSSNNAAATVPASVTVPAGATSATFPISTSAVTAGVNATISATYGATTRSATLAIRNTSLSLSPTAVGGGNTSTATYRLNASVTTPTTAALSSSNTAVATVPASVTIPAGAATATFPVSTSTVTATTAVTTTATHAGINASANLSVRVISPSALSLSPNNLVGGVPSTGTVTLNYAAPAGGYTVTLVSSRTSVATVPPSVTVPAGSRTATFSITTYPVAANTSSSISASGGGVTRSATLTVTVGPAVVSLTLNPTAITSGTTSTATVTLSGAAPSGGTTVTLTSNSTAAATVPASVVVPAGATSTTFTVTAGTVTASTAVTISAAAGGRTATAALTVNP
jgi:hypothetical protein